ncbi:hypothetical protein FRIG_15740 [Frigoribacterium faeni]|uniref:hypothetical protein n=1 Tax=Frigoribacterium faeni TaxID=145483 RepID=UPI001FAC95D3|nr:hypothetical protein [Frigoribacterium faeni]MCJ0702563.1 hypothetical protein [Frigoribacterium faeni]
MYKRQGEAEAPTDERRGGGGGCDGVSGAGGGGGGDGVSLSLIHISEPTRRQEKKNNIC